MTEAAAPAAGMAAPGLFGKLPSRGDFVVRRLPADCRAALDAWLQDCMMTSRRTMGDAWLPSYLNAPVWRFACSAGVCGSEPLAGVLMSSVDSVGRYFPLVLAAQFSGDLTEASSDWFDALERLALAALESDMDPNTLDHAAEAVGLPPAPDSAPGAPGATFWLPGENGGPPTVLRTDGLPPPRAFSSLLTLHWPSGGWQEQRGDGGMRFWTVRPAASIACAGRTHAGTRRPLNQDALLMRPDLGVWAVADGVGGHEAGELASAAVVQHLEQLLTPLGPDAVLDDVHALLEEAHAALRSRAGAIADDAVVASTVAVLALIDGRAAVLWSGDSRVYRWRAGALEQLTTDHADKGGGGRLRHAVGYGESLTTERAIKPAWPGDRYLLCSDGLFKALPEHEITAHLAALGPAEAVSALLDDALVAGARDNVTAVVVHTPSVP